MLCNANVLTDVDTVATGAIVKPSPSYKALSRQGCQRLLHPALLPQVLMLALQCRQLHWQQPLPGPHPAFPPCRSALAPPCLPLPARTRRLGLAEL